MQTAHEAVKPLAGAQPRIATETTPELDALVERIKREAALLPPVGGTLDY